MPIRTSALAAVLLLGLTLACNLFAPSEPRREEFAERRGPEGLVLEGKLKMRNEDWQEALDLFNKALDRDSGTTEAYFYKGKCILRIADVSLSEVWAEIDPSEDAAAGNIEKDDVPFLYNPGDRDLNEMTVDAQGNAVPLVDSVFYERKILYDAVCEAITQLEIIHENYACMDSCEERFREDSLDACMDNCIQMDGRIRRKQYESDYLVEIAVKAVLGLVDLDDDRQLDYDPVNPTTEQEMFRVLVQDVPSIDSLELDSLKQVSRDPNDINPKLDSLRRVVDKAHESDSLFKQELREGAEKSSKLDTTMTQNISDAIDVFHTVLPYYYYHDLRDNDDSYWDTDGDGQVDPMIWMDWDGDDLIDVHSPAQINGGAAHLHIGDSLHRLENPGLYTLVDPANEDYELFVYKGDTCYEWIGGDWSVDEEMMDAKDNDRDGLTDEDTRTVNDTIDDDGDYVELTVTNTLSLGLQAGGKYVRLWGNGRQNRAQLFDNGSVGDTLVDAYGNVYEVIRYIDSSQVDAVLKSLGTDPAYDYARMNPSQIGDTAAIRAETQSAPIKDPTVWNDANGNGKIDGVNASNPAYGTEFLAGDWGVDEEWYDGVDNDNDGLVDEDGGSLPPESLRAVLIQLQSR